MLWLHGCCLKSSASASDRRIASQLGQGSASVPIAGHRERGDTKVAWVIAQSSAIRRIRASMRISASAARIRISTMAPNSRLNPITAANKGHK